MLREVTLKIGLERIDTQEEVTVETLLDRPIYMKNVDGFFHKERPIKHIVEVNIYYQRYRERMEINMIGEQKWSIILGMP